MAKAKTKTKAQLHEEIGELLHSAKIRLEMLGHSGSAAHKEQCAKARAKRSNALISYRNNVFIVRLSS